MLYDDRLESRITTNDYDKYVTKYKNDKEELENRLVEYTNNDKSFVVTAECLLKLAQNAKSVFESSQTTQKNKILRTLLANCKINQKRLQLNLLQPFLALSADSKNQSWLRRPDSAHFWVCQKHFFTQSCSKQAFARDFAPPNLRFEFQHLKSKQKAGPKDPTLGLAPEAGLEPATSKLTASCSTIELLRNMN